MDKKSLGAWGEKVAEVYLKNKGYQTLERNWRQGHKEIDLIVYKKTVLAIEVKTRGSKQMKGFIVLQAAQVERLRIALREYCLLKSLDYESSRLDLIIIYREKDWFFIEHRLDI